MSNTHLCKIASFVALHLGIIIAFGAEIDYVKASLTSHGALVVEKVAEATMLKGAAPAFLPLYEKAAASQNIIMGILLILLGFFLHALVTMRMQKKVKAEVEDDDDERPIKVHQAPRMQRKEPKIFWMEMRISR